MKQSSMFDSFEIPVPFQLSNENKWNLWQAPVIGFDIETDTEDPERLDKDYGLSYNADVTHISLTWTEEPGIGVVLRAPFQESEIKFLRKLFAREDVTLVAHNAIFDTRSLCGHFDIPVPKNPWCTQVVELSLGAHKREETSLLSLAHIYRVPMDFERVQRAKKVRSKINTMPPDELVWYVLEDSRLALAIYNRQLLLIDAMQKKDYPAVRNIIYNMELPYLRECMVMAARGIPIDRDYIVKYAADLRRERYDILMQLQEDGLTHVGNYQQMVEYIFDRCGVPRPDQDNPADEDLFTSTGRYAFNKDALAFYAATYEEKIKLLAQYLKIDRVVMFLDEFLLHSRRDGRVHSMLSTFTQTGRSSSSRPNIQNLPMEAKSKDQYTVRGCLVAPDPYVLVELDLSNAENWMAAMMAGDNALALACTAEDFHSHNAANYFGRAWEDADDATRKRLRSFGKMVTFASAYGAGARSIAKKLDISVEEAQAILDAKDRVYYRVAQEKKIREERANTLGYIESWTGRHIYVDPPVDVRDAKTGEIRRKSFGYRAWNYTCQGGVADLIKTAIVRIALKLRYHKFDSYVVAQIHDSIILALHPDEHDDVLPEVIRIMRTVVPAEWVEKTDPVIEWITDLNHADNAVKWGWRYEREYPFQTTIFDEYGQEQDHVVTVSDEVVSRELKKSRIQTLENRYREMVNTLTDLTSPNKMLVPILQKDGDLLLQPTTETGVVRDWCRAWKRAVDQQMVDPKNINTVHSFLRYAERLEDTLRAFDALEEKLVSAAQEYAQSGSSYDD